LQEALARARIQIAMGEGEESLLQTIEALESYRSDAVLNGRTRSELEIGLVLALAHDALEDREGAVQELARALALAHPRGHRRIFLDEGAPLMALIRRALPNLPEDLAALARALLVLYGQEPRAAEPAGNARLVEPLSEQEQRILRLLAAGHSNAEIAEALFISVNTVKTHVKNIYGKLGVGSRAEVRRAAGQLGLV